MDAVEGEWPPPPPSGGAKRSQRAYYSEMLSQGLSEAEVLSASGCAMADARLSAFPAAAARANFDFSLVPIHQSHTVFEDSAIEPKVMTAFVPKPGSLPRKLEIERRKRLYEAQDVETLLLARGIDYSAPYASALTHEGADHAPDAFAALPLAWFDNSDFEVHQPQAWLATGRDAAGGQRGLPAKVLRLGDELREVGEWWRAQVVDFDEKQDRFVVDFSGGKRIKGAGNAQREQPQTQELELVHRIHICFVAEDPFEYVERVVDAQQRRAAAAAVLLHNLYVDCMPAEGIKPLDGELCARIVALALNTKLLRQTVETAAIVAEVNQDYVRTLNKIVFVATHRKLDGKGSAGAELLAGVTLPAAQVARPARESGTVVLPAGCSFLRAYNEFRFHSCLTRPEIIKIIVNVRGECLKMGHLRFFTHVTKSVRVDEFANAQHEATQSVSSRLREAWPQSVCQHIRQQLKDVKKGWFNLDEANNEVYAFSKLNKFLRFVNFMMQDSIRFLVEASLRAFAAYLTKACDCAVFVKGPRDVQTLYADAESAPTAKQKRLPLFVVELVEADAGPSATFGYATDLLVFEATALKFFDEAMALTQSIVQVERRVMTKLFWSHDPVMMSVHPTESWVVALRADLAETLSKAKEPLLRYAAVYDEFIPFLRQDVESYVQLQQSKYGGPDPGTREEELGEAPVPPLDVAALQKLAEEHVRKQREVEANVPEAAVTVGIFAVSAKSLCRLLADKHATIASRLLGVAAARTTLHAEDSTLAFEKIMQKLSVNPTNIEELTALRAYAESVPEAVAKLQLVIDSSMSNYEALEGVHHKLGPAEFRLQWEVFGWPKKVNDKCAELEDKCLKLERGYEAAMDEAQEEFREKLRGYADEVDNLKGFHDLKLVDQVSAHVRRIQADLAAAEEEARTFNAREILFGKECTQYVCRRFVTFFFLFEEHTGHLLMLRYDELKDVSKAFEPYASMWTMVDLWLHSQKTWLGDAFLSLDAQQIDTDTTTIFRALTKCEKAFDAAQLAGCGAVVKEILHQVNGFRPHVPLITALRQQGMRDRHWANLSDKLGVEVKPDETYTLETIFGMKLNDANCVELITKISEVAGKEFAIESSLDKMEGAWRGVLLQVEAYKETGTGILRGIDEYMALLDEHVTTTQAMTFSAFKGPFEERIDKWNAALQVVSELVDEWVAVQKNWLYLQPIFDSADINKQLPVEGKRFATVDKHWRQTLAAAANPGTMCIAFCNDHKLLERFRESNKLLDMVQKGLSDYLETKRAGFARFYFLSDGDLLEILSETKDPQMVQPHLRKCFEGIKSLNFKEDLTIDFMTSSENEVVRFVGDVDPKGKNIEDWMVEINVAMCGAVRDHMIRAVRAYADMARTEWMCKWPGQVVLNGSQVHWTAEVEAVLSASGHAGIKDYYGQSVQQLEAMVLLIRTDLNKGQRTTVGALAVIDVHARDVVKAMGDSGVSSVTDFDWQSQMRFYWEGDDATGDLWVTQVESKRAYGYEYLGNSFRLVITPLTDKCYLTLMGALQMILGGAPAGPAGTGKTETTKDLAKALAKQCVVFNCSDGLDYRAMGKFFKGLASAGAWACFDEFNRINIEVLSVIAQQIMTLQGAVQRGEDRIIFEDTDINVNPDFAVFITMNPGYAGRSALPDNLEALFRPVAMMVPDYALIGEIMLFSFGYMDGRKCAKKMVATFRLCSEQLSSQDHYDYGMRAVKTVITAAGNLKQAAPDEKEEALLLRALQDVNIPKFLAHDLPLFDGILSDLFPGIQRPPFDYGPLMSSLKHAVVRQNLQTVPIFMRKNIELYEMICVRHGLMVVGPTGGGKSSCIKTLAMALSDLKTAKMEGSRYEKVHVHHLNPKSITMGQLYGMFDANTHEWQDGILASLVRMCIKDTRPDLQWLLFDGPVDAIWIENMNTVLDDNKKLCLTSGEIMSLSDPMTMMFEPEDLAVASPATVSRCGMIYMEPSSLGPDPIILSWLQRLPPLLATPEHRIPLQSLFDTYYRPAYGILRRNCVEPFPTVNGALLDGLLNLLDCAIFDFYPREGVEGQDVEAAKRMETQLEGVFIFAFIWSMCATVDARGRKVFDRWLRAFLNVQGSTYPIPDAGSIYDYCFDRVLDKWVPWMDTVPPYEFDAQATYAELIIPTLDSVRYTYLLDTLVRHDKHVLMTGQTGTGKTVNISRHLQNGVGDAYVPIFVTFSAQTSANQIQDLLDSKCEKRRKGIFGPSAGKKFLCFVDDVRPLSKTRWQTRSPKTSKTR